MAKYGFLGVVAAVLALLLTPWVTALARRLGALDEPNDRRVHNGQVPALGGLAVLTAFLGALALALVTGQLTGGMFSDTTRAWGWLLGGALIVVGCGVIDDVWTLGPVSKLSFQLIAGIMVLAAGHGIAAITNPLTGGSIALGWLGGPLTLLWVVGITNAFNLIDGLDGLAAGVALIALSTLFVVSLVGGQVTVALLAITLGGALAGFLYYNFNPASVFLGDSGSLLLGYLLSILSIRASQKGATAVVVLVPILALGLPIMDTLLAMLRRLLGALHVVRWDSDRNEYRFLVLGSASIFRADREHIHHRLLRMGLTHRRAVLVLYGVCAGFGVMAFLAVRAKGVGLAVLVAMVAMVTYTGIRRLAYQEVEVLRRGTLLPLFELPVLNRRAFHALVDALFVGVAYAASVVVVHPGGPDPGARQDLLHSLIVVVTVKLGVFVSSGIYQRAYRYTNARDLVALAKDLIIAQTLSAAAVAFLYGLPHQAVVVLLLDFYLCATLVIGARISFRLLEVLAQGRGEGHTREVIIYGAGASGTALLREINQNPALGYRVAGFLDDSPSLRGRRVNDVPVLGSGDQLPEVLDHTSIPGVIIASPKIGPDRIEAAAATCRPRGVELRRFRMTLEEVETALSSEEAPPIREAAGG